jgi:hypothetical protein
MSNTANFFLRNRSEKDGKLYFKSWLPSVYFPTIELLKKVTLETATRKYNDDLNSAISLCPRNDKNKTKLERVSRKFWKISQASSWKQ